MVAQLGRVTPGSYPPIEGRLPYLRTQVTIPLGAELPYFGCNRSHKARIEIIGLFVTWNYKEGSNMGSIG